jgi:siroheme synthase (precorrin-2 oxidase/ferrochelatase)
LHAGTLSSTLVRRISEDLEEALGAAYGDFIAALERARDRIGREVRDPDVRRTLLERLVDSDLLEVIREHGPAAGAARIDALLDGVDPSVRPGS